jgi:hypothetical protein
LDSLEEMVCVNLDLSDFSGVRYASALRRVYACGVSLDAIYSAGDAIVEREIELYLWEDDVRELEILERTWGQVFAAWRLVHRWSSAEVSTSVNGVIGEELVIENR